MSANTDAVEAFLTAFNAKDLDALVATLDPEVVIESGRGPRVGIEEARDWATRKPGGVQQHQLIDELLDSGDKVLALNRRQWLWEESGELAAEEEMAYLFTLRDGRILRWQPFEDRDQARRAYDG